MNQPTKASPWRRCGVRAGAVLLLACGFSLPLYAAASAARQQAPSPTARAVRADGAPPHVQHQQARPLTPAERVPQKASRDHLFVDYDRPERTQSATSRLRMSAAAAACDVNAFAAASGSNLVTLVRGSSVDGCLNSLFGLSGTTAGQVFGEAKMVTIADALRSTAASYAGNNNSGALQLIVFLRAGYYVQYGAPADVGEYGAALKNAIRPALDAFVANAHFKDVNDAHGEVLTEFVTLIDSAGENAHQLTTIKGLLDRYNSGYHAYWYMMSAANNVFTVLFRGHYNADFVAAVQSDASITSSLSGFISRNAAEAGTDNEYLLSNASRELARFLQYTTLRPTVKPLVLGVLNSYSLTGTGSAIWVGTADITDYYDHAECSYFGICNFRAEVEQMVLPISHQCSPDLHLRAQALTSAQITAVCDKVINEEEYFHQKLNDNHTPVADDNNTALELVVFHSSSDYQAYSGVIFGNDTNNGGMYLEGNPAQPGNQARFIAYEAEWLRPTFDVWNLTHEYIHYLDGRFDMYGDFNAAMTQPTVWWVEGLAEYISYGYRGLSYPEAIADAGTLQYPLSTIFANDYNSGQERVYRWGYLAARYMFEKQPAQVGAILGYFRPGNYTGYAGYLASIRSTHDADWNQWLTCLSAHDGDTSSCGGTTEPPSSDRPECANASELKDGCEHSNVQVARAGDTAWFYVWVPAGTSSLNVTTAGGSGNADLYVSGRGWPSTSDYDQRSAGSGNTEQVSLTPSATGGYYYIALVATAPYAGITIRASTGAATQPPTPALPECTAGAGALSSGCQYSNVQAARAGDNQYFHIWVPAGTGTLHVRTRGGTGNGDLYVSGRGWPSSSDYDRKSTTAGNDETIDLAAPNGGSWYYVAIPAVTPYAGMAVSAELTP